MRALLFLFIMLKASTSLAQTDSILNVKCDADTVRSYSLLLPRNYHKQQKYPVIFLFDPVARGKMAVDLYRRAATEYGFILIASNNSRNGPMGESLNAANAMFTDAFKKYSIDEQQVYLGGFSGGARVATTIGLQSNGIAGIIACGAGFSEPVPKNKLPWTLSTIAGTTDFNYIELQQLASDLAATETECFLQTFNGPHRWPPVDVFMSALLWSYLKHHKQGGNYLQKEYKLLTDAILAKSNSVTEKASIYRHYPGIKSDTAYANQLKELEASPSYQNEQAREKQMLQKELEYQQKVADAFQQIMIANTAAIKTKSWWRGELVALNKMLLTRSKVDTDYVARQKSFITANATESFGNYYYTKRYDTANEFLTVTETFEPENPVVFYRHALLAAADRDEGGTVLYLKEAIKHGYTNKRQLSAEPVFGFLNGNKQFRDLLN